MQQQQASWAAKHFTSWVLTAHLGSTKASPAALWLFTRSQKWTLKQALSSIPSWLFPQQQANAIQNIYSQALPLFLYSTLVTCHLASAWVVIQMEMQHEGSHPHLWWVLTGFGSITLLTDALPKLQQHSVPQISQTNSSPLLLKTVCARWI